MHSYERWTRHVEDCHPLVVGLSQGNPSSPSCRLRGRAAGAPRGGPVSAPHAPSGGALASSQHLAGSFLLGASAGFVSEGLPEASVTFSVPFCSASYLPKNAANASRGKKIECDTSVDLAFPQEYSFSRPSCFEVQTPVPLSRSSKRPCALAGSRASNQRSSAYSPASHLGGRIEKCPGKGGSSNAFAHHRGLPFCLTPTLQSLTASPYISK